MLLHVLPSFFLLVLHIPLATKAFHAPTLASVVNPAVDTCAADPEAWVKGGMVTSVEQEAAVQRILSAAHNNTFLWGTYQPNQYFAVKSRTAPATVMMGLLWHGPGRRIGDTRNECRQEDHIRKYGWTQHDGRYYGKQAIDDVAQDVALETEYVRLDKKEDGYWATRIHVKPSHHKDQVMEDEEEEGDDDDDEEQEDRQQRHHDRQQQQQAVVYLYLAIDCDGSVGPGQCLATAGGEGGLKLLVDRSKGMGAAYIHGKTKELGDFTLEIGASTVDSPASSLSISYWGGSGVMVADLKARLENDARRRAATAGAAGNGGSPNGQGARRPRTLVAGGSGSSVTDTLPDKVSDFSNVMVLRIASAGAFQIDTRLRARAPPSDVDDQDEDDDEEDEPGEEDVVFLKALLDKATEKGQKRFQERFAKTFALDQHGYQGRPFSPQEIEAAQAAFSNMIGGVGYFHGRTPIKGTPDLDNGETPVVASFPTSLFTAVPSRSFFPRGFLWDEGFHQLLLHKWDLALTYDVLLHWLSHMHTHPDCPDLGWIPREIALGEQARRRIPAEFLPQDVTVANPPTFLLTLEKVLAMSEGGMDKQCESGEEGNDAPAILRRLDFLAAIQDRLERWVRWLLSSQRGEEPGSFRWRGRGDPGEKLMATTFASGLDDYPRATEPGPEERHVDLLCWVIKGCQILSRLAEAQAQGGGAGSATDAKKQAAKYADVAKELQSAMDALHWNETMGGYFDYGLHSEDGFIGETYAMRCGDPVTKRAVDIRVEKSVLMQWDPKNEENLETPCPPDFPVAVGMLSREPTVAYVRGPEVINQHVPRVGYVSLFPFLLGLLPPDSPRLGRILATLRDPAQLWSPYGIRSLSAADPYYQQENAPGDAPYWRGYIWINANYLILRALWHLSRAQGPYQEQAQSLYTELRDALLGTILGQYQATGFFWEQYHDVTGKGMRCHPFTGWTALVVNIMAEDY